MLSIVIPTYQEEKFLGRLLESIKNQTLQPDEIIVSDNFSKDRTREIAKEYGCIVVDGGNNPAIGRNKGAKAAKGDILLFFDADVNVINKKYLEKFVEAFKKRDLDIATTFVKYENAGVKELVANLSVNANKVFNSLFLRHFRKVSSEVGINIMMTKKLFDEMGEFDESKNIHEDSDVFMRVMEKGAKYGLVALSVDTSDRRFKKMTGQSFAKISLLVVYGFFSRFLGFEDNQKYIQKYEELYGKLGGDDHRISIIIPTYQEEKYLGNLLESIKKQTLQPFEIIVADNKSKDKTREIAKKYGCRIVDGGNPAKGRNEGAKAAKGNLLLFFDSDTLLKKKTFIEKFYKAFIKRRLDMATTFITFDKFTPKTFIVMFGLFYNKISNELVLKHFKRVASESGPCIMVKKELFEAVGRFDETLDVNEDAEIFQRLSKTGARYGVVGLNIKTSERRFKDMKAKDFVVISSSMVYGFFARFMGIKDSKRFNKRFSDSYGELGGEE